MDSRQSTLKLEELLAETDLSQSWRARDQATGELCFVKRLSPGERTPKEAARALLERSYANQARIRSSRIITATAIVQDGDELSIVYPYLDPSHWRPLDVVSLWRHFPASLVEICTILDFLHLSGLVHADLKLENFLIHESENGARIALVDLDYLSEAGAPAGALVLGTPGHIAPEIRRNERILSQSDAYSLGESLRSVLAGPESGIPNGISDQVSSGLAAFAEDLTQEDPYARPASLLGGLVTHGVMAQSEWNVTQRRLFGMYVLSGFRRSRGTRASLIDSGDILGERNQILGIPQELLTSFTHAYARSHLGCFRAVRRLLVEAEVSLFGNYWQIRVSDSTAFHAYEQLSNSEGSAEIRATWDLAKRHDYPGLEMKARAMVDRGQPLLAYLACTQSLTGDEPPPDVGDATAKARLLQLLADTATELGRPAEAAELLEIHLQLLELAGSPPAARLSARQSLARLQITAGDLARAYSEASGGLVLATQTGDEAEMLEFRRLLAWLDGATGRVDAAEQDLQSVLTAAQKLRHHGMRAKALNDLGTVSWRQGRFPEAQAYYEQSENIQSEHGLEGLRVRSAVGLAMVHYELAEYERCLGYARTAIEGMRGAHERLAFDSVSSYLVLCLSLLARFPEAEQWLQRFLRDKSEPRDRRFYGLYYFLLGRLRLDEGRIAEAREALLLALQILEDGAPERFVGKAHQSLAELAFCQGEERRFRDHLRKASAQFERLGDRTSPIELQCWEDLFQLSYSPAPDAVDVVADLEELVRAHSYITAQQVLCQLLLECDAATCRRAIDVVQPILPEGGGPGRAALRELVAWRSAEPQDNPMAIQHLKAALRLAQQSGALLGVCRICQSLASIYAAQLRGRVALRFVQHAERVAAALGNLPLLRQLDALRACIAGGDPSDRRLIQTLHGISGILGRIGNPDDAFERMVEYAMMETGAERGVLLLRAVDGETLHVRAAVNCDGASLQDIESISRNVPAKVLEEGEPVIIGDASRESSLKRYKSIAVHNILSILCVPVIQGRERIGVLYLDHHTVPTLFDANDILFVQSAANLIAGLVETSRQLASARRSRDQLTDDLASSGVRGAVVVASPVMVDLYERLPDIAASRAAILLLGETGVGKEVVADSIHHMSPRRSGPIIRLNCAAVSESMVESELFGIVDKAATNVAGREGKFAAADGGTLFLDEIGDMAPETQARVLRALEYGTFEKVGSNRTLHADVRVIAASNKNLEELVEAGTFRKDLYYRVSTFALTIPPLRQRPEDIPALAEHFAEIFATARSMPIRFSRDAVAAMLRYRWPGNVRELRNLIEKLTVLHPGEMILPTHLPAELLRAPDASLPSKKVAEEHEKREIEHLLTKHDGNKSAVAKDMGIPISTLFYRMRKYGIA